MMRELHHFQSKFDSVLTLRAKLIEEFKQNVPDSMTFYYENRMWIVTADIKAMYTRFKTGYGVKVVLKTISARGKKCKKGKT